MLISLMMCGSQRGQSLCLMLRMLRMLRMSACMAKIIGIPRPDARRACGEMTAATPTTPATPPIRAVSYAVATTN